jgi:hypothetical protein
MKRVTRRYMRCDRNSGKGEKKMGVLTALPTAVTEVFRKHQQHRTFTHWVSHVTLVRSCPQALSDVRGELALRESKYTLRDLGRVSLTGLTAACAGRIDNLRLFLFFSLSPYHISSTCHHACRSTRKARQAPAAGRRHSQRESDD